MKAPRVRLTKQARGVMMTEFQADIEVDGVKIGYVQRTRGDNRYLAYADGLRIGSGYTLTEVKEEIMQYVTHDRRE